eukprot:scaffold54069_cov17-Prasinocladus_malaysianus.AAC.1
MAFSSFPRHHSSRRMNGRTTDVDRLEHPSAWLGGRDYSRYTSSTMTLRVSQSSDGNARSSSDGGCM